MMVANKAQRWGRRKRIAPAYSKKGTGPASRCDAFATAGGTQRAFG